VTLPAIRWGLAYGVVLATARALGEFGAVSVVSGRISGETETLPLFVQSQFDKFNAAGAYAAGLVLAVLALLVLFSMNFLQRRSARSVDADDDDGETPSATSVFVPQPIEKGA
jgi:sulfate/thiosulfate transport system permease protein